MFPGGRDLVLRSSELATLAAIFSFRYYAGLAPFIWHSTSKENATPVPVLTLLRNLSHPLTDTEISLPTLLYYILLEI
jgi:hypothetical protein